MDRFAPALLQLAQVGNPVARVRELWVWLGAIIVVVVLLGIALMLLRRRMFNRQSEADAAGTMMEELRQMRRRGELSDAEFDKARRSLGQTISRSLSAENKARPEKPRAQSRSSQPSRPRPRRPAPGQSDPLPGYDLTGEPLPRPRDPE